MQPKAKTSTEIETVLRERIASCEALIQIAGIVRETAAKMDGQKATKRFATAVQAALVAQMDETFHAHWDSDTFGMKLTIWASDKVPNVPHWNDRAVFYIGRKDVGYVSDPSETLSADWIVKNNQAFYLESERLPKFKEALETGKAANWAAKMAQMAALRSEVAAEANIYGALYLLDL